MKKLYIIQTQDLRDPNKYGFIRDETNPELEGSEPIRTFKSRWRAKIFLRYNISQLKRGYAHIITPIYVKP